METATCKPTVLGEKYHTRLNLLKYEYDKSAQPVDQAFLHGDAEQLLRNLKKMSHSRRESLTYTDKDGSYAGKEAYARLLHAAQHTVDTTMPAAVVPYTSPAERKEAQNSKDIALLTKRWEDNIESRMEEGIIDYHADAPVLAAFYEKARKLGATELTKRIDAVTNGLRTFAEYARDENMADFLTAGDWTPEAKVAALRVKKHYHAGDFGAMLNNLYADEMRQVRREVVVTGKHYLVDMLGDIVHTDAKPAEAPVAVPASIDVTVEGAPALKARGAFAGKLLEYVNGARRMVATLAIGALLSCGKGDGEKKVEMRDPVPAVATPDVKKAAVHGETYVWGTKESCDKDAPYVAPVVPVAPALKEAPKPEPVPEKKEIVVVKESPKLAPVPEKKEVAVEKAVPVVEKRASLDSVLDARASKLPMLSNDSDFDVRAIVKGGAYIDSDMMQLSGNGKLIFDLGDWGFDVYGNGFAQKQDLDTVDIDGTGGRAWVGMHKYFDIGNRASLYAEVAGGIEDRNFTIKPENGDNFDFGNTSPFLNFKLGLTDGALDEDDFGVGNRHSSVLAQITKHFGSSTGDVEGNGFGDEYSALRAQIRAQLMLSDDVSLQLGGSLFKEEFGDFLKQDNKSLEAGFRWHLGENERQAYVEALAVYRDLHSEVMGAESDDRKVGFQLGGGYRLMDNGSTALDLGVDGGWLDSKNGKDEWFVAPSLKLYFGGSRKK
jgi:hypothetical protein